MNYKAVVLDLDGTLMTSLNTISVKTEAVLKRLQQEGIIVILASGRPTIGLQEAVNQLHLPFYHGYILSYNGGIIQDTKTQEILFETSLEVTMIHELYHESRRLKTHIMAYKGDTIITEDDDPFIQIEKRINQMQIHHVDDFISSTKEKSVKCLMTSPEEHLVQVEKELKGKYNGILSISRSMPYFLECMPQGINKGACLLKLLDHLKIHPDEVIAFGDGYNDVSLIESVGCGIAMENGCTLIKEKAKFITKSNDEDGIPYALERILNQKRRSL